MNAICKRNRVYIFDSGTSNNDNITYDLIVTVGSYDINMLRIWYINKMPSNQIIIIGQATVKQ